MIKLTKEEFYYARNESMGICLKCDEDAYGVEPDAREYRCESCNARAVYGIEELLLMGKIDIVEDAQ